MTLSERLSEVSKPRLCPFALMALSMPEKDLEALTKAIKDGIPWRQIQRALRAEGYKTSAESMTAHRKGECRCPR